MEQDTPARPERRDLPVEVWLTIVQSLRGGLDSHFRLYPVRLFDKRTLKTLRRVSRALYDITDPLYWEHVELSAMARPEEVLETVKHLKTNPARWNYVKYLVLQGWRADNEVPQNQNDVRAASEVLPELFTSLQNLQALHFQNMHLTPSMVAHLYALPKLHSARPWKTPHPFPVFGENGTTAKPGPERISEYPRLDGAIREPHHLGETASVGFGEIRNLQAPTGGIIQQPPEV
ncbi:hypothetical protein FRC01_002420 [Tulasnella sp. 417]|nr:hypothetical protein FRC01_002420 [Tulasnella sp. 417]